MGRSVANSAPFSAGGLLFVTPGFLVQVHIFLQLIADFFRRATFQHCKFMQVLVDHPLPRDVAGKDACIQGKNLRAEYGIVYVPSCNDKKYDQCFL